MSPDLLHAMSIAVYVCAGIAVLCGIDAHKNEHRDRVHGFYVLGALGSSFLAVALQVTLIAIG